MAQPGSANEPCLVLSMCFRALPHFIKELLEILDSLGKTTLKNPGRNTQLSRF